MAAADGQLVVGLFGHGRGRLGGHRTARARIEVDAGADGRQSGADHGEPLRLAAEGVGGTTAVSIADDARPRPPGVPRHDRLDGRTARPSRRAHPRRPMAAGRYRARRSTRRAASRAPSTSTGGRTWSTKTRSIGTFHLAAPDRVAAMASRAGIGDGPRSWSTTTPRACTPPACGGRLRAYGLEDVRTAGRRVRGVGRGGSAGLERRVSRAWAACRASRRAGRNQLRLTTADVRGLLGLTRTSRSSTPGRPPSTRASRATRADSATSRARRRAHRDDTRRLAATACRQTRYGQAPRRQCQPRGADGHLRRLRRRGGQAALSCPSSGTRTSPSTTGAGGMGDRLDLPVDRQALDRSIAGEHFDLPAGRFGPCPDRPPRPVARSCPAATDPLRCAAPRSGPARG